MWGLENKAGCSHHKKFSKFKSVCKTKKLYIVSILSDRRSNAKKCDGLAKKAVEKMDGGTVGVMILGCAALATGYFAYDSHNHRVVVEQ